eukprot:3516561-Pyramimonas_sp.AAC.1
MFTSLLVHLQIGVRFLVHWVADRRGLSHPHGVDLGCFGRLFHAGGVSPEDTVANSRMKQSSGARPPPTAQCRNAE